MNALPGHLYLVGTPIGNLEDMTFRAVRILQSVDLIAAEDTRHTGKLLQHFQVQTPQISYHEHNHQSRVDELITRLRQDKSVALVTDAGMPGVSDPGYELVCACLDQSIPVVPIPGPTAAITALCVSGLPTDKFVFEGFLPLKHTARQERLTVLQPETRTLILYEAPHRLLKTLTDLQSVLGPDRRITLGRELTKRFEEFWRGTLAEALAHYEAEAPKGEFTLVIEGTPPSAQVFSEAALKSELERLLESGVSRGDASRQLAASTGLSKKQIYQLSLTLDGEGG
ncbi:MAG: 16S rRNA (cytidine(1402)-2'-O)-methyltransferase [Cyanobacteria bacterium Co-bin8]|nr:16S rRNA (cytidine(1402)-2'-O)-methyltransferase [Cyanobacteria bacterium Co-bin8]